MRFTLILIFITTLLSSNDYIRIVGFNVEERDSRVDLSISFSDQYASRVTRQVGDSVTKLIMDNVRLDKSDMKILNSNTVISKIELHPYEDRVELILFVMGKAKIVYRRIDGGYGFVIEIHDTTFASDDEIVAKGESAFDSLSIEYFFTLVILMIALVILFFVKKNTDEKQKSQRLKNRKDMESLHNMDMLLDTTPPINNSGHLLDRVQPPKMKFKTKKNPNSQKDKNAIGNGIAEDFNFGNPKIQENSSTNSGLQKYPQSSGISILSEETTEIGRIAVLKIDDIKYTIMEGVNGTITLLNKEGLSEKSRENITKQIQEEYHKEQMKKEDLKNFFQSKSLE
jgi:hypothetical protein